MTHYPRLSRRKSGIYEFRAKVPQDLREAYGMREEKKSLDTKDLREAVERLHVHSVRFDHRIRDLKKQRDAKFITTVTDAQLEELATGWLRERRERHLEGERMAKSPLGDGQLQNVLDTLEFDVDSLSDELARGDLSGISHAASQWLGRQNVRLNPKEDQFWRFCRLFLSAHLKHARQSLAHYQGTADPFAPSLSLEARVAPALKASAMSFAELVNRFKDRHRFGELSQKARDKMEAACELFTEIFGEDRAISMITPDDCLRVDNIVRRLPANREKKFPGRTIAQVLEIAKERKLAPMSVLTQRGYLSRLKQLFLYAKSAGHIDRNPADIIEMPRDPIAKNKKRDSFAIDQLRRIFSAPLYTGCLNDEKGAHRAGPNVLRRGRFWVPLISLYQGMRLNECCQLGTSDIRDIDGIWIIRVEADEEQGKRVKTDSGARDLPIHPELARMGFVDFAMECRQRHQTRLFPELEADALGYFSGPFSKAFSYFLKKVGVKEAKLNFHSFRHTFADALRRTSILPERQDRLGGWSGEKSERSTYGNGLDAASLYEDIRQVSYPGLDLTHLHVTAYTPSGP